MSSWVTSKKFSAPVEKGAKRKAPTKRKSPNISIPEDGTWVERFAPQSREDLAIHKKKVEEVEAWMKSHLEDRRGEPAILLVVGPTGCGKSITLKVLSSERNIHLREWSHPVIENRFFEKGDDSWKYSGFNEAPTERVVDNFADFLFQGSRYKSLFDSEAARMILLDDIPASFGRNVEDFHECLRKYRKYGKCPLVISLCETASSREFKLLPPDLKTELSIETISFNPISTTLLTKALKSIVQTAMTVYGKRFSIPTDVQLNGIVQSCQGDLRLAINLLEMSCQGTAKVVDNFGKKKTTTNKKETKQTDPLTKDGSLYLFHSLGKILYCKREEKVVQSLPGHLKHLEKPPTKECPEEVFAKTCVSQDLFVRMLHNNATKFYTNIKSASGCLESFSIGDHISSSWDPSGVLDSLSLSVTMRGLMFHLEKRPGKGSFGSFSKPSYDQRRVESLRERVRENFLIEGTSSEVLERDILPYSFLIRPRNLSQEQWNVINDSVLVKRSVRVLTASEANLSEKDVPEEENDRSLHTNDGDKTTEREEAERTHHGGTATTLDAAEVNSCHETIASNQIQNNACADEDVDIEEVDFE